MAVRVEQGATMEESDRNKVSVLKYTANNKSCFEQRANNAGEQYKNYFNGPVSFVPKSKLKEVPSIVQGMNAAMKEVGIGLAHNQYPKTEDMKNPCAIFVVDSQYIQNRQLSKDFEAFVNPVIVGYSTETKELFHGCLSAIGAERARVATYKEILIAYHSDDGSEEIKVNKFEKLAAIICQHEYNHLATKGTYVDTTNYYYTGDRFKQSTQGYLSDDQIDALELNGMLDNEGDGVPNLTTLENIAQCKRFLKINEAYKKAVDKYLSVNPADQSLHNNLLAVDDSILDKAEKTTYYDVDYPSLTR
jgi:peptide deformylase